MPVMGSSHVRFRQKKWTNKCCPWNVNHAQCFRAKMISNVVFALAYADRMYIFRNMLLMFERLAFWYQKKTSFKTYDGVSMSVHSAAPRRAIRPAHHMANALEFRFDASRLWQTSWGAWDQGPRVWSGQDGCISPPRSKVIQKLEISIVRWQFHLDPFVDFRCICLRGRNH